jgi:hypothetical protein
MKRNLEYIHLVFTFITKFQYFCVLIATSHENFSLSLTKLELEQQLIIWYFIVAKHYIYMLVKPQPQTTIVNNF